MTLSYVLRISRKSLMARKTRTAVTIGGIVIGVGAIVLLVSLGYGLQNLVTQQVAQVDALTLTEVRNGKSSAVKISDDTLTTFRAMPNVVEAVPLVNVAGKVHFSNATTDIVAFGTTARYLELNSIHPVGRSIDSASSAKEVIINTALQKVLNLSSPAQAIGQAITVDFVMTPSIAPDLTETATREAGAYTIIGVIQDTSSPTVYVAMNQLIAFGVKYYGQVSVRVKASSDLAPIRTGIESLGFQTSSIADTVSQINQIFSVFRIILAAVGAIALIIAALGMFNTLTVSLLERTREIGFMKALGTRDYDVYRIFMTEAILIAFLGGIVGLAAGHYVGSLANWILNFLAARSGNLPVHIIITPWTFAGAIVLFSLLVGFLTGIFPARRAAKINPLDALRYE